jgi:hypothetical protein
MAFQLRSLISLLSESCGYKKSQKCDGISTNSQQTEGPGGGTDPCGYGTDREPTRPDPTTEGPGVLVEPSVVLAAGKAPAVPSVCLD